MKTYITLRELRSRQESLYRKRINYDHQQSPLYEELAPQEVYQKKPSRK